MSVELHRKVGVLIHGFHLQADGWEEVVWGSPPVSLGRVPKGIMEALLRGAEFIFWGTGSSQKNGLKDSEYAFKMATEHIDMLAGVYHMPAGELLSYLKRVSFIDTKTHNTVEEVTAALEECSARGIEELYLVSSPTHIARCYQEALKIISSGKYPRLRVYACASDISFIGTTPADVVVVEPPHRGDQPKYPLHKYIADIFKIPRERLNEFIGRLADLISTYSG